MGGVFELLAAEPWNNDEFGFDVGEGGEVAPEFFELEDGEDVFLSVAPAFFDFFEGDVGGESVCDFANGGGDLEVVFVDDVVSGELEEIEELIEVNPGGHGVVVGEGEFVFFARHGESFEKSGLAVDGGEATSSVFESSGDDFVGESSV